MKHWWVFSVYILSVNSLIPLEFKKFVMNAVSQREQLYISKRRNEIDISPEFANLFAEPATISSM